MINPYVAAACQQYNDFQMDLVRRMVRDLMRLGYTMEAAINVILTMTAKAGLPER